MQRAIRSIVCKSNLQRWSGGFPAGPPPPPPRTTLVRKVFQSIQQLSPFTITSVRPNRPQVHQLAANTLSTFYVSLGGASVKYLTAVVSPAGVSRFSCEAQKAGSEEVAVGINIFKAGSDPPLLADSECPDWLWGLAEAPLTLGQLQRKGDAQLEIPLVRLPAICLVMRQNIRHHLRAFNIALQYCTGITRFDLRPLYGPSEHAPAPKGLVRRFGLDMGATSAR